MAKSTNNQSKRRAALNQKRPLLQRIKDALQTLINQQNSYYGGPIHQRVIQENIPFTVCENFVTYASEGYAGNPVVYGCIRLKANIAAELQWNLYTLKPDGEREEYKGEHRLKEILKRPNERQPWHEWLEEYITYSDLAGVVPIHGAKPNNELNFLRPDLLKPKVGANRQVTNYEYTYDASKPPEILKPDDVCYITLTNPIDEFDGVSPAEAAASSIDLNNLARLWNKEKIKNTVGLGSVFLTGDIPFTENQIEATKEIIAEQYTGPQSAGKNAIIEAEDIKSLSDTVRDMDWLNVMDQSASDILKAFNVPAELMSESATYENREAAKREFFTNAIFPMCDKLKDALNHWLVPQYGDNLEIDFDKEDVSALQEDVNAITQRAITLATSTIITRDEARDMLGFEPAEGGDMWLEPAQQLLSEVGAPRSEPEPKPEAEPEVTVKPIIPPPEPEAEVMRSIGALRTKLERDKELKRKAKK